MPAFFGRDSSTAGSSNGRYRFEKRKVPAAVIQEC